LHALRSPCHSYWIHFVYDRGGKGSRDRRRKLPPPYLEAPEFKVRGDVPVGEIHEFTLSSADSKLYPGVKEPYQRKLAVYVPKQYVPGTEAPFIVAQDGLSYKGSLPRVLDNLIAAKRVPVQIAILIDSGGGDGPGSERGLEYDTVSEKYALFVENEVLPRVAKDYGVKLTSNPEGRAAMGGSSGGAAAFSMGWFRPDLYRRILTYSGTYVNQQAPKNPESPHGAWEFAENWIPKSEPKPLRVWLEVGEKDNGFARGDANLHNWVAGNVRMAAALKARNYHYRYVFAQGAGHNDGKVMHATLPDALVWLWKGWPDK
jgi:enterochelin esterase-like enzyme